MPHLELDCPPGLSLVSPHDAPAFRISLSDSFCQREPTAVWLDLDRFLDFAGNPLPLVRHALRRDAVARRLAIDAAVDAALAGDDLPLDASTGGLIRSLQEATSATERLAAAQVWRERQRSGVTRWLKARLPVWSPITWRGASTAANAVETAAAVFDYDGGARIEDVVERLRGCVVGALHTTLRHTATTHRFRLVLPYAAPVPAARHRDALRAVARLLPPGFDAAANDLAEWCLRPVRLRADATYRGMRLGGPGAGLLAVDLGVLPEAPRPAPPPVAPPGVLLLPTERERVGLARGGRLTSDGRAVRGLLCPHCARRSAWFWLDPRGLADARCNHRESCGWQGPLSLL